MPSWPFELAYDGHTLLLDTFTLIEWHSTSSSHEKQDCKQSKKHWCYQHEVASKQLDEHQNQKVNQGAKRSHFMKTT